MMRRRRPFLRGLLVLSAPILMCACAASPPLRYYTLEPVTGAAPITAHDPPVWVERVSLPAQLDRPQIVRRTGPNRLDFDDLDRWAAPLDSQFTSVLARDLADRMAPGQVIMPGAPLPAGNLRRLTIEVLTFEGDLQGQVVLQAGWAVVQGMPAKVIVRQSARITAAGGSGAPAAIAAAMSQAMGQLADQIAASLAAAPA